MLVTPDFTSEDSRANSFRRDGVQQSIDTCSHILSEDEIRASYESMTRYPEVLKPGLVASHDCQGVLNSNNWRWYETTFESLKDEVRSKVHGYGYCTEEKHLDDLLKLLEDIPGEFFVSAAYGILDAEKPWKAGYHLTDPEGEYKYAGKEVIFYNVWEKQN